MTERPAVTALYVPGDRPDRFDKAAASGADVVILDLEDAVAPSRKDAARAHVVGWLDRQRADGRRLPTSTGSDPAESRNLPHVQVRVNPRETAWGVDDLAALPPSVDIRLPKVEQPADVDAVGQARRVHAVVESALGVENAFAIASHPAVVSVGLGEADLRADLGLPPDEVGLAWPRSRVVVAARAAGLPAPLMSVYADVRDLDGLAVSCRVGRTMGFAGRAAIHPSQVPVIAECFAPTDTELAWADQVLTALAAADGGVATVPSGAMVDEAMARRARDILARRAP